MGNGQQSSPRESVHEFDKQLKRIKGKLNIGYHTQDRQMKLKGCIVTERTTRNWGQTDPKIPPIVKALPRIDQPTVLFGYILRVWSSSQNRSVACTVHWSWTFQLLTGFCKYSICSVFLNMKMLPIVRAIIISLLVSVRTKNIHWKFGPIFLGVRENTTPTPHTW